jgi:hypothetical protein
VVTAKLQEMGVTGVDAIEKIQAAVRKAGNLETLVKGVMAVENGLAIAAKAAPIAGAAVVAAMTAAAKATIAFAETVNKVNNTAIKLGVGIEQVDKFRAGLEKAGVSAESVAQILQSKMAAEWGIDGVQSFIKSLEQVPDSAARSRAAVQAFGEAGAELIRILQAGGKLTGFATTGLISAEDAQKATQLGIALNQLETTINRFSTISFAPTLTVGINAAIAAIEVLGQRVSTVSGTFSTIAQGLGTPFQLAAQLVVASIGQIISKTQELGQTAGQPAAAFTSFGTVASQSATQASTAFTSLGTVVAQTGQAAATAGQTAAQGGQTAAAGWEPFLAKLREVASAAGRILSGGGGGGGSAPGMAAGGVIGGSGTGTSDSNLAWVSRGEHIMPAHAVAQPGVLALLEALRRSGGNLGRVLDGMGHFALGGLVPRSIPAFASGGMVGSMSNVTIQFPGLPAISGLRASAGVVDQLHKAAALAQVRSGGRKPSRYS